jgi:hypothetical protein
MTSSDSPPTPADILRAALEAKRQAAAKSGPPGRGSGRRSERDAAALSASKSKPAMRR